MDRIARSYYIQKMLRRREILECSAGWQKRKEKEKIKLRRQ
jgi:hypothetical protein